MNTNRYNDSLPTGLEEQTYAEIRHHFSEHLNQFSAAQGEIRRLEQDLSRVARAVNLTTSRTAPSRIRIQTGDGASWYTSVELMDNCWACYRPTRDGTEFAAVELSPSGGAPEVVAKGRSAAEVVQAFARDQRQALKLWTEDLRAQVNEFLNEKYSGQDMSRVAERFMHQLAHSVSHDQTLSNACRPSHRRGIRHWKIP